MNTVSVTTWGNTCVLWLVKTFVEGRRAQKKCEFYSFIFKNDDEESMHEALMALHRFASNQELSFTWDDNSACGHQVRLRLQALWAKRAGVTFRAKGLE